MGLVDSIIGVESGGNPNAANPRSSASGLGQFIDSTFLATFKSSRPDLAQGMSDQQILALKTDPQISREMTEAYANQNQAYLTKNGVSVTPGSTYLAHFAGPGGAVNVLQARPETPVSQILGQSAIEANPFLRGMTAADLQAWADRKMGGQAAKPASPVASAIMGQQPAAAPMSSSTIASQLTGVEAPQSVPQAAPMQSAAIQAAPIQFVQRRSPDLSKLRALFGSPMARG